MAHIITKLTKDDIRIALLKNILENTEAEIRTVFDIFDFQLKEFNKSNDFADFEIHFKRTYLIHIKADKSKLECSNEYITFQDNDNSSCHGLAIPLPATLAEVLMFFINSFASNILKSAGYTVSYDEENSVYSSIEEAQEYMKLVQDVCENIIKKGGEHE